MTPAAAEAVSVDNGSAEGRVPGVPPVGAGDTVGAGVAAEAAGATGGAGLAQDEPTSAAAAAPAT